MSETKRREDFVFLSTDANYQWVAALDTHDSYIVYRIHRWSTAPAEIVKSGIDLKAARKLAG